MSSVMSEAKEAANCRGGEGLQFVPISRNLRAFLFAAASGAMFGCSSTSATSANPPISDAGASDAATSAAVLDAPMSDAADARASFTIYGFITYGYVDGGVTNKAPAPSAYLQAHGVEPVRLVYEPRLLQPSDQGNDAGIADTSLIQGVAEAALADPTTLVALDIESWDRFLVSTTEPKYEQVISVFKEANSVSRVGFYAIVPQDTFGYDSTTASKYDPLNAKYAALAQKVDYYAPSLYNYNAMTDATWVSFARYQVGAANKYGTGKPIIPYITPEVTTGGVTSFLTHDQMLLRLQTLRTLGASGCIVWTSTGGKNAGGTFDPSSGWASAIRDFEGLP